MKEDAKKQELQKLAQEANTALFKVEKQLLSSINSTKEQAVELIKIRQLFLNFLSNNNNRKKLQKN